jgi:23S rRNA (guanosine2251-2'-O)-methyltransferase
MHPVSGAMALSCPSPSETGCIVVPVHHRTRSGVPSQHEQETVVLEGLISITASLEAGQRRVTAILLDQDRPHRFRNHIERLAHRFGVPLSLVDGTAITAAATGHSHGGVIAFAGRRRFATIEQLADRIPHPFLVLLDGFEDPYTFGHAVRALYAAGVDGLILRDRQWDSATATICRSSAGASERLPTALVAHPLDAVTALRRRAIPIVCATHSPRAIDLDMAILDGPMLLILGGEKRGVGRAVSDAADVHVRIPYARPFTSSLTLSTAAAIVAFEVARQRARRPIRVPGST